VGSSISLSNRFKTYYSLSYITKRIERGSSAIYSALLKYGYSKFSLDILEYCEPNILISREQYYINSLSPEYNILKIAGSRLGTKQIEKTKELIRRALKNRIFSEESKTKMQKMAKLRIGKKTSFFGKSHTVETINKISVNKSILVKVTDIETGIDKIFVGNTQAAKYLNIGESTLRRYKKLNKLFKWKIFNIECLNI
jgi:group I intron endonuclease